jgi:biotin synthesis protein BioG
MKFKWIQKSNAPNLILFFNGWGMDEHALCQMSDTKFDVLMAYQYQKPNDVLQFDLQQYSKLYLVAWSMGVAMAKEFLNHTNFTFCQTVAINGTLSPIDDNNGIPTAIFDGTLRNYSEPTRAKFGKRMFGELSKQSNDRLYQSQRSTPELLEELIWLKSKFEKTTTEQIKLFDKVIIGTNDLIFPYQNQKNAWNKHESVHEWTCPHFPFFHLNHWETILS